VRRSESGSRACATKPGEFIRRALCFSVTVLSVCTARAAAPEYGYKIIHVFPHDRTAFTEGLEYRDGFLYESTGLEGKSVFSRKSVFRRRSSAKASP
jgi:glutamine cyclotransferase